MFEDVAFHFEWFQIARNLNKDLVAEEVALVAVAEFVLQLCQNLNQNQILGELKPLLLLNSRIIDDILQKLVNWI